MSESIDHTLRGSWTPSGAGAAPLSAHAVRWLRQRTGLGEQLTPAVPPSLIEIPEDVLPQAAHAELVALVGAENVLTEPGQRLGRAGGLSYSDLIRRRRGTGVTVPDAVVLPADPGQVQRVLELCVRHDLAVVPFGGGTSVVGGVDALRGDKVAAVTLDLARLDRLISVDPVSHVAVMQAGMRAPDAEALLAAHGFTLGHFPQSFERATIGGFAATRSAGQASSGYGRFESLVEGVRLATPAGEWQLGTAPASAAGPDLRHLAVGSEGALGVITEVALRVRPAPVHSRYEAVILDGWQSGSDAVRALAQSHALADVTRLSDRDETEVQVELSGGMQARVLWALLRARRVHEPCMLVLGWDAATRRELDDRRDATWRVLRRFRPVRLGDKVGESWKANRFSGPRQRDTLLDYGVCVETLETATHWAGLSELRSAVRAALLRTLESEGKPPIVMCHLSHAYETGASLYFTVLAVRDQQDPLGQWQRAKQAATEAITERSPGRAMGRGTITHHHAVGTDHKPWLAGEVGPVGVRVLAAAKQAVDPTGILNPGKLVDGE
ncbi:alkyldihydroxyacetonephosphate synthase [Halopolyspora algeriensis]|uniref:Alkyldihydroxyacetonephosphate synthase n=1 Tax=Halopolyspora algeriensis TaxID=1500506 RepID=A0A368VQ65_9ACTN|nr:FAD-binding oxidoreductase [Halopolyspora algeriensis]RCW43644.1 alkyldihydroxyacetonephosphate synthase [Halopolyspora algeriensis]TQM47573.1 alkyldihydroxyacetonephosphate synthase [Halopolyspora algeriensis]